MTVWERVCSCWSRICHHKRLYGSYILIVIGSAGLIEHLLTTGYSWHIYQHVTCHGFWLGIVPILIGFLLSAKRKED